VDIHKVLKEKGDSQGKEKADGYKLQQLQALHLADGFTVGLIPQIAHISGRFGHRKKATRALKIDRIYARTYW
jgi:hypothetical protein